MYEPTQYHNTAFICVMMTCVSCLSALPLSLRGCLSKHLFPNRCNVRSTSETSVQLLASPCCSEEDRKTSFIVIVTSLCPCQFPGKKGIVNTKKTFTARYQLGKGYKRVSEALNSQVKQVSYEKRRIWRSSMCSTGKLLCFAFVIY